MNLVVHLQKKAIRKHGYEMATRQAWKCGIKANLVKRVVGIFKGQIVCVVEGCRAELSTPLNNPLHDEDKQGRYVFVGGIFWEPNNIIAPGFPDFMFMHLRNLSHRHKYLTDDELFLSLA
ncbi:acyl-CoA synthetase [Vibrio alfacsensis]|uniref:acyl-CoA synthetase n=1 Tax=Vibrio alfacsensis TaxID=1074311 RepID=UPI00406829DD